MNLHAISEIFWTFLKLGLTSFGGPIAHLGYFRTAFVEQRKWLSDDDYAQLVALCQFLPGPASSQVGYSLGLYRGGWLGGLAAFIGFTLPSAIALILLALWLPSLNHPIADAAIHGLKLVALVVVAQAVWQMSKGLTPDWTRRLIALAVFVGLLFIQHPLAQLGAIALSGVAGYFLCQRTPSLTSFNLALSYSRHTAWALLGVFAMLLIGLPLLAQTSMLASLFDGLYRAGAMVFGGGHVVLPLLENTVVTPGWVSADDYLGGYGAAQAMPGPVFSVAAYLGVLTPVEQGPLVGAFAALLGIFLPGLLLVSAALPLWHRFVLYPAARSVVAGINAGVVGLLALALYDPIWTSSVQSISDFVIGLIGLVLLFRFNVSALYIVLWCLASSIIIGLL